MGVRKKNKYGLILASSLVATSLIVGSWIFLFVLAGLDLFYYAAEELIWLLIFLLESMWMLGLTVGTPLYVGLQKGLKEGLLTFGAMMGWMFLFLFTLVVVLAIISTGQNAGLFEILF